MSCGGTRSGMSFSGAWVGEHPAATPVAPRTLRKNRLPMPAPLMTRSLVAGDAIDVRLPRVVAVDAEPHVHVLDPNVVRHVRDVPMAFGALDRPRQVPLVAEVDVVRLAEDASELERLSLFGEGLDRLDGGLFLAGELVTAHARRKRREAGHRGVARVGMAGAAADQVLGHVDLVVELREGAVRCDHGTAVRIARLRGGARGEREYQDGGAGSEAHFASANSAGAAFPGATVTLTSGVFSFGFQTASWYVPGGTFSIR